MNEQIKTIWSRCELYSAFRPYPRNAWHVAVGQIEGISRRIIGEMVRNEAYQAGR